MLILFNAQCLGLVDYSYLYIELEFQSVQCNEIHIPICVYIIESKYFLLNALNYCNHEYKCTYNYTFSNYKLYNRCIYNCS